MTTYSTFRRTFAAASTVALVGFGSVVFATPASAADFPNVDTETELVDAIDAANGDSEADVIYLTGTGFTLTMGDLPKVTSDITFVGPGSGSFTIDGGGNEVFNLFGPPGTPPDVVISGVTITNAATVASEDANLALTDVHVLSGGLYFARGNLHIAGSVFENAGGHGARIEVENSQIVHIEDSTFDDNGVFGLRIDAYGSTSITLDNLFANGNGDDGIHLYAEDDSVVTVNTFGADNNVGDGMSIYSGGAADITVNDATSRSNGYQGLEVFAEGAQAAITLNRTVSTDNGDEGIDIDVVDGAQVNVSGADIRLNSPGIGIGAESNGGLVSIDAATIDDNIYISGGGVNIDAIGVDVAISNSTISNNRSLGGAGVSATLDPEGSLTIVNSTISGNHAGDSEGAIFVRAGQEPGGEFILAHSTVTDNHSDENAAISIWEGISASISHSIVAGNTGGTGDLELLSADGTIDYSLIEAPGPEAQTAAEAGTGNVLGFAAGLGPLADNGGPTLTHVPLATSRALSAGDPNVTGEPATDQRGSARVVGVIEIGAVEVEATLAATGTDPNSALLSGIVALGFGMLLLAGAAWRKTGA